MAIGVGALLGACSCRRAVPRGRAGEDVRRTESRTIAVARPVERVCRDRPPNRRILRVVWKACVASHVHVHAASRRTLRLPPRTLPHEHDQHHRYRQKILSTRPRPLNGRHQHNGARPTLAPRPYHVPARMRALLASHGGRGGGGGSSSTNDERCCATAIDTPSPCSATPAIAEVIGSSTLAVFISVRPASWSSSPSRALPR